MTTPQNSLQPMPTRLARSTGRAGRNRVANARVTVEEQRELCAVARSAGVSLSEWAREVLLREARRSTLDAIFTELIATRMLMLNLLKPLVLGEKVSSAWITEAMTVVRTEKHKAAQDVMRQYTRNDNKEEIQ